MATHKISSRLYVTAITFIFSGAVFGWLRYDWIKHAVAWRHDLRFWQYALPVAAGMSLSILAYRNRILANDVHANRALRHLSLVGVMGASLAIAQFLLAPSNPWLLYGWMALLGWAGWLLTPFLGLSDLTRKKSLVFVLTAMTCMIVMHIWLQLRMWHDLSYGYRDIGLFVRALHNAANGQGLWVDSLDRSILGEHTFFALWVFVPLCKLGADPLMVLVGASSIMLNGPALIIYWYARKRCVSNVNSVIAAMSWLLLPWLGCLIFAHSYGFHPIYMSISVLLVGLALTELGQYRRAALVMLLAVLIREDIALTVAAWSVYVFWVKRRHFLSSCVFVISAAYLLIAIYYIIPHYRGGTYPHIAFNFAGTAGRQLTIQQVLLNLSFLFTLFMPLAALPFRQWRLLCIAIPALAEALFTTNNELHNICYQYYTPAIAVLFFASVEACWNGVPHSHEPGAESRGRSPALSNARTPGADALPRRTVRPGWCLLVCALTGQVYLGLGPMSNNPARPYSSAGLRSEAASIADIKNLIPRDTSVTASYRIASHFLDHKRLWMVQDESLGDCVIIDDRDNWDASDPRAAIIRAHRLGGYRPLLADYHLVVLVKDVNLPHGYERFMPAEIPVDFETLAYELGHGIELVARRINIGRQIGGGKRECQISLIWKAHEPADRDYRFGLVLEGSKARWGPFFFVRGAYPTVVWLSGRLYRDDIDIILPEGLLAELSSMKPVLLY